MDNRGLPLECGMADKDDQPKKPFVDRVLEKATEHLRAEIAKK